MRWLLFFILFSSFALAQPITYCNGCNFEGKCVSFNSQVKTSQGVFYCAEDSKVYPAKADSAPCSGNFECFSFFCSNGICSSGSVEQLVFSSHSTFFLIGMALGSLIILGIGFLIFWYLFKSPAPKKVVKTPSKQQPQPSIPTTVRLMPVKRKYSQFENLEKSLEESSKKIIRK
ncbi:MAG: hypothetical protein QW404_01250 [Candidatus Nanoarchaeia archaeon]